MSEEFLYIILSSWNRDGDPKTEFVIAKDPWIGFIQLYGDEISCALADCGYTIDPEEEDEKIVIQTLKKILKDDYTKLGKINQEFRSGLEDYCIMDVKKVAVSELISGTFKF